jgi:hypothetical protein
MDPTNERWRDPTPPWLILSFLSFAAIGFAKDWRLGLGLLALSQLPLAFGGCWS